MLEAAIPKDIRKYDAKLVGPFTTRQLFCFLGGAAVSFCFYKVFGSSMNTDLVLSICTLVASPFLVLGWYRPYGMVFEKFFKTAFVSTILSPKNRKYKTNNLFSTIREAPKPISQKEYKKRLKFDKKQNKAGKGFTAYK